MTLKEARKRWFEHAVSSTPDLAGEQVSAAYGGHCVTYFGEVVKALEDMLMESQHGPNPYRAESAHTAAVRILRTAKEVDA